MNTPQPFIERKDAENASTIRPSAEIVMIGAYWFVLEFGRVLCHDGFFREAKITSIG